VVISVGGDGGFFRHCRVTSMSVQYGRTAFGPPQLQPIGGFTRTPFYPYGYDGEAQYNVQVRYILEVKHST